MDEVVTGQRSVQRQGEYLICFDILTYYLNCFICVLFGTCISRMGPDRNGFRDRMFGREPYPPPPPPPFLRERMMGRFGVRVSNKYKYFVYAK